ncbi:helix-turn-helix transcriptional regulator [Micromonospora sp. NPDC005413]|uniref:helix-turn-helix transcriptional regulator n=1 Tax=Micromonospora sp. NPDC005413 TaxID=3154563 RepID=UPI0033A964E9
MVRLRPGARRRRPGRAGTRRHCAGDQRLPDARVGGGCHGRGGVRPTRRPAPGQPARPSGRCAAGALRWILAAVDSRPSDREGLTPRERQICELASTGHDNAAIAAQLVLSVRTVENHLRRAYVKLGVRGRNGLPSAIGAQRAG